MSFFLRNVHCFHHLLIKVEAASTLFETHYDLYQPIVSDLDSAITACYCHFSNITFISPYLYIYSCQCGHISSFTFGNSSPSTSPPPEGLEYFILLLLPVPHILCEFCCCCCYCYNKWTIWNCHFVGQKRLSTGNFRLGSVT